MKVGWGIADEECPDKDAVAFICIKDIKRVANEFNGENLAFDLDKSDAIELIRILLKGLIKKAFK